MPQKQELADKDSKRIRITMLEELGKKPGNINRKFLYKIIYKKRKMQILQIKISLDFIIISQNVSKKYIN